jgi:hypothetical protein
MMRAVVFAITLEPSGNVIKMATPVRPAWVSPSNIVTSESDPHGIDAGSNIGPGFRPAIGLSLMHTSVIKKV